MAKKTEFDKYLSVNKTIAASNCKTEFISHRGFSKRLPENTLEAFQYAGEIGYKYVECDIAELKDGHFILLHDSTVNRATDGEGNIVDKTLKEALDLNVKLLPDYYHNHIGKQIKLAKLDEFLVLCKKYAIHPVIEIKRLNADSSLNKLIDQINEHLTNYTIISFNVDWCKMVKKINSSIEVYHLTSKIPTVDSLNNLNDAGVYISINNSSIDLKDLSWVKYAKCLGMRISCWTVNDYARAKQLIDINIDFITTDLLIDYHSDSFLNKCVGINPTTLSPLLVEVKTYNPTDLSVFSTDNQFIQSSDNEMLSMNMIRVAGSDMFILNCDKVYEETYNTKLLYFDGNGVILDDKSWCLCNVESQLSPAIYCMFYSIRKDEAKITDKDINNFRNVSFTIFKRNQRLNIV